MGRRFAAAGSVVAAAAGVLAAVLVPACHKNNVTAPTLTATCSAQPASGNAPLAVLFALAVAGAEGSFNVAVSYGDGASGTSPDQPHVYTTAGAFTAAFTVTTATQSARCSAVVTVAAAPLPTPLPNEPPVPVYKSVPAASGTSLGGTAPFSVRWNMCASSDPDHDILWFRFDFDGDGHFDQEGTTGANCRTDHVYNAGTFRTKLCVHDVSSSYEQLHADQCRVYTVTVTP
jgi:hypothetical protein